MNIVADLLKILTTPLEGKSEFLLDASLVSVGIALVILGVARFYLTRMAA